MEAFKYLILLTILIIIIGFGFYILLKGVIKKNNGLKYSSLIFIGIPLFVILYNLFPTFLTNKPTDKELIGIYRIVSAENGIPESDYNKYSLSLKKDGTFEFTKTPGINLCENGNYDLDYELVGNELSFQCGQNWTSACIKRKIIGFEIEFFNSEKEIRFKKNE
ncbi:hypothetical protein [uncultured Aquimarina sp.]|uniref:hypothetical protein n=1 Tax=uncultured Aquimarina sp. TaxID=575652 RepID=UPI002626A66C|nr:hypothetical protein [uncultured Aquimarina sp.]